MHLDHANIVTPDLDRTVRFFTQILGLTLGPRPGFGVPGAWLYHQDRPLIHLTQATAGLPAARVAPRIDHIALRIDDPSQWAAIITRLRSHGIAYQISESDELLDRQLWVSLAPGLTIELIGAQ